MNNQLKNIKKEVINRIRKDYGKRVTIVNKWWNIVRWILSLLGIIFLIIIAFAIYLELNPEVFQALIA